MIAVVTIMFVAILIGWGFSSLYNDLLHREDDNEDTLI